jgi:phage terminase large subunit GpA-like protein
MVTELSATLAMADEAQPLWRPPSKMTLSEWADRNRILSTETSAEPGQWTTSRAEYEREIMDAISDPDVPRICVMKAAQMGISDCLLNAVGYFMDTDPGPLMYVLPTIEIGESFSVDRVRPMLRDSPRLHGLVAEPRAKDSSNTLRRMTFPGGFLVIAGANSAASLSARAIRVLFLDETDRYGASAGSEGNPIQLAVARTTSFPNRKIVLVSSPGVAGASHIEREMEHSTKEHWHLECPFCGFPQVLEWTRIRFSDFTHRCTECGEYAPKYRWLASRGQWRASQPFDERGQPILVRGFYISGLYNPWIDWATLGIEFARANAAAKKSDLEPLKTFRNTRLGELWHPPARKVETNLYERREVYRYT